MSALLLRMASDKGMSFQEFKDHVITMSGRIVFNKRKSPLHAVAPEPERDHDNDDNDDNEL